MHEFRFGSDTHVLIGGRTVQDNPYVSSRLAPARGRGVYLARGRDGEWVALRVYINKSRREDGSVFAAVNLSQLKQDATRNVYASHATPYN